MGRALSISFDMSGCRAVCHYGFLVFFFATGTASLYSQAQDPGIQRPPTDLQGTHETQQTGAVALGSESRLFAL